MYNVYIYIYYLYIYVYIYIVHTYTYIYICIHINIRLCMYIYIRVYVCVYVCYILMLVVVPITCPFCNHDCCTHSLWPGSLIRAHGARSTSHNSRSDIIRCHSPLGLRWAVSFCLALWLFHVALENHHF
jgi:hypothetical protein